MKTKTIQSLFSQFMRTLKVAFLLGTSFSLQASTSHPNILLVVSDDQGFGDVGWNNPEVRTPVLDQLARDGIRLDRFYANPICSVTRAALMTGFASLRTGVNNSSGLDLKYRILPQAFKDAGYQTWMFGKWHLGGPEDYQRSGKAYVPYSRGFDSFYGHLHGAIDYYTHRRKDLDQLDWQRNGLPMDEEGFTTDLLVEEAIRKIQSRDASRPFFAYLAFNAIHGPLQPPPSAPHLSKREKRPVLLANLTHMDTALGRLLTILDQQGLREDTLVLFFGDNGGQLSQGASNGPLRGEKGNTFEGGIRVPAAIRWPGRLPAGQVSQQFLSVMDVYPTLCTAAGIPTGLPTSIDGVDLWPAIATRQNIPHPPFVMGNKDVACFSTPWKMILPGRGEKPLLFDILQDPTESTDVAIQHPDIIASLSRVVQATGDPSSSGRGNKNKEGQTGKKPGNKPAKPEKKKNQKAKP